MLNRHIPLVLLSSILLKTAILGSSLSDAIIIIGLIALFSFHLLLESKREPEANKDIKNRLLELEEQVKDTKSSVNAMKIGSQFRLNK